MLLADQGYTPSNSPEWIANLHSQALLLSVTGGDQDDRPDQETIDAVEGYQLLRIDQNGWIRLSTDGNQLWVEVERR